MIEVLLQKSSGGRAAAVAIFRLCVFASLRLCALPALAAAQSPKLHHLPATPGTVAWGYYSAAATPALRIASGDIVEVETLLTSTPERLEAAGVPKDQVEPSLRAITTTVTDKGPGGHILTGPVYVEGAEPGDVLEVRILSVALAIPYGYNGCSGFLRDLCAEPRTRIIQLDRKHLRADLGGGIVVPLRPFFGSMGVAPPPDSGRVSSNPPGIHAGNLDNKELVAGTTLFIPVHAPGALFEVGDGHAAQGDGEVDQTAIETSLLGRLQLVVRKDLKLVWPRVETPTHWITMGTDTSLTVATRIAVREMVGFLMEARRLPQVEAYRLASIAADLHITQLVDGRVGVHMMMPKAVLGAPDPMSPAPRRPEGDQP
jgi:acetamidase/formamidase